MPSNGEWAAIGLILAAFAGVGVALYLTRKKPSGPVAYPGGSPGGPPFVYLGSEPQFYLRQRQPAVVLQNEERAEFVRDRGGRLSEIVVHRKVIR